MSKLSVLVGSICLVLAASLGVAVPGAVASDPERFGAWLKPGGRLFVIHGQSPVQEALRITRRGEGFHRESLFETDVPYLHGAAPAPHFSF